ncbi:hypothetical protein [Lentzea jiangxiensis]|uniref:Uncharacterized protein n=1 Tax=Lentzea jiangxiensis TaxID=641025 RepID=A0A1H0X5S0_9PSEU|nr:hypothetical protein [Lentzea jiangxiensis]SDP97806.1 hypothetical protein SAMN05421507_13410 [Lentzea jiangxiensis]
MTENASITEMLEDIDLFLELGGFAEARELAAQILDTADTDTLDLLARIAWIRENHPNTARARLSDAWKRSTPEHRELVETCVMLHVEPATQPAEAEAPAEPEILRADVHIPTHAEVAELRTGGISAVEAGPVRRKIKPEIRRKRRPARTPEQKRLDREVAHYFRHRAGVDDAVEFETLPGYENDEDQNFMAPLRGLACVSCWTERAAFDNYRHHDGLCNECRQDNRAGLPITSTDPYRDELIAIRCAHIVKTFPKRPTALAILRRDYRGYAPGDRIEMNTWVAQNFRWAVNKPATPAPQYATAA